MKRYLLTVLLAVFALGGIGTYYVHGAVHPLPAYRIAVTEGDEALFDRLVVTAFQSHPSPPRQLEISLAGSEYEHERSVFDIRRSIHPLEAELGVHARRFLRGKWASPVNFYLDGQTVVYAETQDVPAADGRADVFVNVEMMDLESGKRSDFRVLLESGVAGLWPYVADVQRIGEELHLFVEYGGEYRVYVLAMDGRLVRMVQVSLPPAVLEGERDGSVRMSLAANHRPQDPKSVVGILVKIYGTREDGTDPADGGQEAPAGGTMTGESAGDLGDPPGLTRMDAGDGPRLQRIDLYVYDYAAEDVRPAGRYELGGSTEQWYNLMTGRHHVLYRYGENGLEMLRMSLADGGVERFVYTAEQLGGHPVRTFTREGHLYVLTHAGDGSLEGAGITVLDLDRAAVAARAVVAPANRAAEDPAAVTLLLEDFALR